MEKCYNKHDCIKNSRNNLEVNKYGKNYNPVLEKDLWEHNLI